MFIFTLNRLNITYVFQYYFISYPPQLCPIYLYLFRTSQVITFINNTLIFFYYCLKFDLLVKKQYIEIMLK